MEKITKLNQIFDKLDEDADAVREGSLDTHKADSICKIYNTAMKVDSAIVQRLRIKERTKRTTKI